MRKLLILLALGLPAGAVPGKTMLDYSDELHLSAEQSTRLKADLVFFVKHSDELRTQMQQAEKLVVQKIQAHAALPQLQQAVAQAEDLRSQLRYQDVTTSRKVRALLTAEQWAQWQQIKLKNSGGKTQ
ncbi:MAG: hypothetical protein U0931_30295 [Vulcanimicrobiota bacterium]